MEIIKEINRTITNARTAGDLVTAETLINLAAKAGDIDNTCRSLLKLRIVLKAMEWRTEA